MASALWFCLNHEMDYIPQKYVNYFVLRFADKAEIFTVYSTVYRQSDAFPNVQRVKKKHIPRNVLSL